MLRMFTVFNLCPKIPSREFLVCKMLSVHKFTDAKGLLLMIQKLGFLNFIRKQDFKFREKRETNQTSLLGIPWRKVDHDYNRFQGKYCSLLKHILPEWHLIELKSVNGS